MSINLKFCILLITKPTQFLLGRDMQIKRGKRRALELKKIEDQEAQRVSLAKRRKGLIKKCIELSVMCSQDIFVVIFDQ